MAEKMPVIERRSRIICHFPINRLATGARPNQLRVIHEFIRFLKRTNLTGFTTSSLIENVCTGFWRATDADEFEKENVVLVVIDHPLDRDDVELWKFVADLKNEIQRLYKRFAHRKEQDVWIVVHSIDRLL